jgi:hypothetical protein
MSSTADILKNVQKKLDNNKTNDIVKKIETPSTKNIKMNVPDNPFMSDDGSDGIQTDELNAKQNMMFKNYLKRNGYKDFGDWWREEGKEEINDIYSEAVMENDTSNNYWWDSYLKDNLNTIINKLQFIRVLVNPNL